MIDRSQVNAERMMTVLNCVLTPSGLSMDFTTKHLERPKVQIPVKNVRHNFNLDILTPWAGLSYSDLKTRSEAGRINSTEIRIVSKADLIALKEYAVQHEPNAEKHRRDLRCLKDQ